jgi:hypothetical protein
MELTGGCLCGAVRFRVTEKQFAAYYCHCTICQKHSGGPFITAAMVPIEALLFTKGNPKAYESSPGFVRLFCSTCGSPMGGRAKDNPQLATFRIGCLDDPNSIGPALHIYTSTQIPWCEVSDDLPRYAKAGPELDSMWGELDD